MRLLILMGLGLTLTVTSACQNDRKRRTPLLKGKQAQAGLSERSKVINGLIGEGKCLRVDKLLKAFTTAPSETLLMYTADVPTLEQSDNEPILDVTSAKDLLSGTSKSFLLSIGDIDDNCTKDAQVSFSNSGVKAVFKILPSKSKDQLLLENMADANEKIAYTYDRKDKLTITHLAPSVHNGCGKSSAGIVKKTYVLTRGAGLNNLEISRSLTRLFERHITLPAEVHAAFAANISRTTTSNVALSYPGYVMIQKALASMKRPLCPTDG